MKKILFLLFSAALFSVVLINCSADSKTTEQSSKTKKRTKDISEAETTDKKDQTQNILFFGNSLTAGLGIDTDDGFVNLIQNHIDDLGKKYKCINAGLSGETTAGGKNRIDWVLKNNKVSIFVLELGGNDGLRGIDPKSSKANLQAIIDVVKKNDPLTKILLAGMEAPPNMGGTYTASFRKIYAELSKENELDLIPFLLDRVGGIAELNQADGIHPNEKGQVRVKENILKFLEPML